MSHKKQERAVREAFRKERQARKQGYLEADENFIGFSNQLATQGFKLKDIPGDGNCLFRALADQLEGDIGQHMRHRRETVDYIVQHRSEFEPFVEDGVPFERYVRNLAQNGTFGGNDALVAFSRLHKVNIIIHRLNEPCWQVIASDSPSARELHVSYHNGDHYSSVRKITDAGIGPGMTERDKVSARLDKLQDKKAKYQSKSKGSSSVEANESEGDMMETVKAATQCTDTSLIEQTLADTGFDVDATISMIFQLMDIQEASSHPHGIAEEPGGSQEAESSIATACAMPKQAEKKVETVKNISHVDGESKSKAERTRERLQDGNKHLSNRQRKEKAKRERKERRLDEQRGKAREHHAANSRQDNNTRDLDKMTATVGMLSI